MVKVLTQSLRYIRGRRGRASSLLALLLFSLSIVATDLPPAQTQDGFGVCRFHDSNSQNQSPSAPDSHHRHDGKCCLPQIHGSVGLPAGQPPFLLFVYSGGVSVVPSQPLPALAAGYLTSRSARAPPRFS